MNFGFIHPVTRRRSDLDPRYHRFRAALAGQTLKRFRFRTVRPSRAGVGKSAIALFALVLMIAIIGIVLSIGPGSASYGSSPTGSSSTTSSKALISMFTQMLFSGTATNATSQGTALMFFVLQNPGPATVITAVLISGHDLPSRVAVYRCSTLFMCSQVFTPTSPPVLVAAHASSNFTTPATGFSLGSPLETDVSYNYAIILANGQSINGSLTAMSRVPRV